MPDPADHLPPDFAAHDFVEKAGRHLWEAVKLYRANVPPDEDGGPDVSLLRFLYNLQEDTPRAADRPTG